MRVIAKAALRAFWKHHEDAQQALEKWYAVMTHADFQSLVDVRKIFSHADLCGPGRQLTCFNIKGNKYRLIAQILYIPQIVYIRDVLTHAEYSKKYGGG